MPTGYYYKAVLGNNGGLGNRIKTHEYGHALWGGEHEDITPNPVLYRRAYLGADDTWGNYATTMAQSNFGGGVRIHRFSSSDPNAEYYIESIDHTFSPVGTADRDMCRRITEEWNRPGIVQVITIPSPTVTTHPGDETVCEGDLFTLTAAGNNVDNYQWYKNGTAISGATSASYTVSSATAGDAGSYYCELSNTCDVVNTNTATVTVNLQAVVTTHPQDVTVLVEDPFTLTAAGNNVDNYQWYKNGTAISGATSASYTVSSATAGDAGSYYCELSNSCGSVNTNTATVMVEEYSLTINPTSATVSANAGNTSFTITSNESWSIVTSVPEVTATPSSGSGDESINISYPAINTMASATYTVTVTSGSGIIVDFTLNQNGVSAFITLTPDQANVPSNAGQLTFTVDCPSDLIWNITGLADWLSATPLSGTGAETVTLNYEANTDQNSRSDDFSVSGSGVSADFNLTQVGANATLEAYASSDKAFYFIGETIQLFGSATGGTGNYSYEWTGTGGFTSSEQNPTFDPTNVGTYTFTVVVDDGENTDTDNVVVTVDELSIYLESSTQNALTGVPVEFTIFAELADGSLASVDEVIFETDGDELSGFVNPWEFEYVYQNISGSPYDVEVTVLTSSGFILNVSYPNYMDVIVSVGEQPTKNNIKIYPNPSSGKVFIDTQERPEMVSVVNESGNEVLSITNPKKSITLDLSHLPSGTYMVQLSLKDNTIIEKVVKL